MLMDIDLRRRRGAHHFFMALDGTFEFGAAARRAGEFGAAARRAGAGKIPEPVASCCVTFCF